MLDNSEEPLEELKRKIEDIERQLENLEDLSGGGESEDVEDSGYIQVTHGQAEFILHWIKPEEIDSDDPCDISGVSKAQEIFRDIINARKTADDKREILHGDVLVLLCNTAEEEDEETGELSYPDSCYYIGMCIQVGGGQDENPISDIKIGDPVKSGDETVNDVIVWDTCGGDSCPDNADTIRIDEIIFPEDDGSLAEDLKFGLTVTEPDPERNLATIDTLSTLKLEKQIPESSGSDPVPDAYGLFKNPTPVTEGLQGAETGVSFEFSTEFLYENQKYDYKGTSDRVSLFAADVTGQLAQYSNVDIEIHTVSISSGKCGDLKKLPAEDDSEPPQPLKETKQILISDNIASSQEFPLSSLRAQSASGEIEIENVLELNSLQDSGDLIISGNTGVDNFFIPKLPTDVINQGDIEIETEMTVITDFKIEMTQEPVENEDNCFRIKITPSKKTRDLTFNSGVLTKAEDETSWEEQTAIEFTTTTCEPMGCELSLTVNYPSPIGDAVSITALPVGSATNEHPDCAARYEGSVDTFDGGDTGVTRNVTVFRRVSSLVGNGLVNRIEVSDFETFNCTDADGQGSTTFSSGEARFEMAYEPHPEDDAANGFFAGSLRGTYQAISSFASLGKASDCGAMDDEVNHVDGTASVS